MSTIEGPTYVKVTHYFARCPMCAESHKYEYGDDAREFVRVHTEDCYKVRSPHSQTGEEDSA